MHVRRSGRSAQAVFQPICILGRLSQETLSWQRLADFGSPWTDSALTCEVTGLARHMCVHEAALLRPRRYCARRWGHRRQLQILRRGWCARKPRERGQNSVCSHGAFGTSVGFGMGQNWHMKAFQDHPRERTRNECKAARAGWPRLAESRGPRSGLGRMEPPRVGNPRCAFPNPSWFVQLFPDDQGALANWQEARVRSPMAMGQLLMMHQSTRRRCDHAQE